MTAIDPGFGRKARDAAAAAVAYPRPMIRITMNGRDWAILGFLALIWGGAFFLIGVAVRHVPPFTYVLVRLSIAAAAMWAILAWRRETLALPRAAWSAIVLLALLNNALPFTLFGWAQTHIASGLASILNATTPIWGVIVAHLFTADEKITPRKLAGVVVGFAGVAVMIGPGLLGTLGGGVLAELACVVAALAYALAGVWARRFRAMGISPFSVTTGQLTVGAAMMLPVALVGDRPWTMALPPLQAWAAIATLAIVCTALGYVLYFRLIDRAGATNALLVTLLVPPTAILLGVLFLGEVIAAHDFAGLALIALGLAAIDGRLLSATGRLLERLRPRLRPAA
jgi:drug/metabolite transporter (DMT)-like permease